jgi:ADP-ribose pyrophosphatase
LKRGLAVGVLAQDGANLPGFADHAQAVFRCIGFHHVACPSRLVLMLFPVYSRRGQVIPAEEALSLAARHEHLIEKTKNSETIFEGRVISLNVQTVELPNGKEAKREVVLHPGAVTVLAITEEDKILLVRQYRTATGCVLVETPAGKLEQGEDPLECAKRELEEETGYLAKEWRKMNSFFTSPGFSDELIHCYVATGLTRKEQSLDADEFLDVIEASADEVRKMIDSEEIYDAKTLLAAYWWFLERAGQGKR